MSEFWLRLVADLRIICRDLRVICRAKCLIFKAGKGGEAIRNPSLTPPFPVVTPE